MATEVELQRTGTRQGVVRNARGAQVRFGPADLPGAFTPGELLAAALAACTMMSADHSLTRRLPEPAPALSTHVRLTLDRVANRYTHGQIELRTDTSGLDEQARRELTDVVTRAARRGCTVGRSIGMPYDLRIGGTA